MNTITKTYTNDVKNIKNKTDISFFIKEKTQKEIGNKGFSDKFINKINLFLENIISKINIKEIESFSLSVYNEKTIDIVWKNIYFHILVNIKDDGKKHKSHFYGRNNKPKDRDINKVGNIDDIYDYLYSWFKEIEFFYD